MFANTIKVRGWYKFEKTISPGNIIENNQFRYGKFWFKTKTEVEPFWLWFSQSYTKLVLDTEQVSI